jgi:hypothetical protein
MVLTVEPGIYFNDYQIDKGLANPDQAQYLVKERLEGFRNFGGARIEDMVRTATRAPRMCSCAATRCPVQSSTVAFNFVCHRCCKNHAGSRDSYRDRADDNYPPRCRTGGGNLSRWHLRSQDRRGDTNELSPRISILNAFITCTRAAQRYRGASLAALKGAHAGGPSH